MARFALRRYAFLSLLVAALFSGSAVRAEEDENLRKELELIVRDLASLDQTIAASDKLLAQNPWATTTSCAWIVGGTGRFVALTGGKQWQLDDYIRAAANRANAQDLINKARDRVAAQTKVCNDPLFRNAAQFKTDRTARLARKAEIEKRLAAPPPAPIAPAAAWSGNWRTSGEDRNTFRMSFVDGRFVCKGTVGVSGSDNEGEIFSEDKCDWSSTKPDNCYYTQRTERFVEGYKWKAEGTSTFKMVDGIVTRTTKLTKIEVTEWEPNFARKWVPSGDVNKFQAGILTKLKRVYATEEFILTKGRR